MPDYSHSIPTTAMLDSSVHATLAQKAMLSFHLIQGNHLTAGQVWPAVTEPAGIDTEATCHIEQATEMTGRYLASLSLAAACTGSPDWLVTAIEETLRALETAASVTGIPGLLARGYAQGGMPAAHQESGSRNPWRESGEYAWLSGAGVDTYAAVFFGFSVLHDICASDGQKERMAVLVDDVLRRLLDNGLVLTDEQESPIPGGSLAPGTIRLPRRVLGLQALQLFRIGYRITKESVYLDQYQMLAGEHEYARKGIQLSGVPGGDGWGFADDCRAFEAYYHLLQYEEDPNLRSTFRHNMDVAWDKISRQERAYLGIIYQALTPSPGGTDEVTRALIHIPVEKEILHPLSPSGRESESPFPVLIEERPAVAFEWQASPYRVWPAKTRFAPVDYLLAYWMGRYHGVVPAPPVSPSITAPEQS